MTPPTGLGHKGDVVEEWIDLHFFRPLGMGLVRWFAPTRVSADQLTAVSLMLGLVAGHLFLYSSTALNATGLGLFILSDIFDSADGQLARLRGEGTRFGRILDGLSDNARFVNLYLHLIARLILSGTMSWMAAAVLGLAAGYSHSLQSAVADYLRQLWLEITGAGGELDLPEDLVDLPLTSRLERFQVGTYRRYVNRQARWCARSAAVVRALRRGGAPAGMAESWRRRQRSTVARAALIGQNVRFLLLGLTVCLGWTAAFFWVTLVPLNLVLGWLLLSHERIAGELLHPARPAARFAVAGES